MDNLFEKKHINFAFKVMVFFFVIFFVIKLLRFENWFFQFTFPLWMSFIWFVATLIFFVFLKSIFPEIYMIVFPGNNSFLKKGTNPKGSNQEEESEDFPMEKTSVGKKIKDKIFKSKNDELNSIMNGEKERKGSKINLNIGEDVNIYDLYDKKADATQNSKYGWRDGEDSSQTTYKEREEDEVDFKINKSDKDAKPFTDDQAKKIARRIKKVLRD